jgi:hypothetical protein
MGGKKKKKPRVRGVDKNLLRQIYKESHINSPVGVRLSLPRSVYELLTKLAEGQECSAQDLIEEALRRYVQSVLLEARCAELAVAASSGCILTEMRNRGGADSGER